MWLPHLLQQDDQKHHHGEGQTGNDPPAGGNVAATPEEEEKHHQHHHKKHHHDKVKSMAGTHDATAVTVNNHPPPLPASPNGKNGPQVLKNPRSSHQIFPIIFILTLGLCSSSFKW